ncbi:AMP-binding protein [Herbidospora daliensis]|uniref:AMP-binding protein n=1 Tax=Herbidospora daliensis TaxID=295585 RepID=UPI00078061CF|nr:AMP-binding protein [Herbidospora daliensis]
MKRAPGHLPVAIWFDGDLDVPALFAACTAVAARHRVLSALVTESGELVDGPAPAVSVAAGATPDIVAAEIARPFDLDHGPLARFTLAPAGEGRHLLLFVAHRLVFDELSKDVLVRDLARHYDDPRTSWEPVEFEPPAATPLDVEAAGYTLPGQRRSARLGPGERVEGDDAVLASAAAVAAAAGVTTFEALLAGVHALLFRYGVETPAVLVDVTTRGPHTRDHIGPYVNEVPVVTRPHDPLSFHDFTREVRAQVRGLDRTARPARPPSIPVSLSYRRAGAPPEFRGLGVTVDHTVSAEGVRGPLHLQVVDGLGSWSRFDPEALDRETVVRFRDALGTLLAHAAAEPEVTVGELDVIPAADREKLLVTWNDTRVAHPPVTLPELFAAQVRTTPHAVAVWYDDRTLTYAELDMAAGRLAGRLRRLGVGPGDLVAVRIPRSDDLLIALLAVVRTGAAYLPLDPCHPAERLDAIVDDAQPKLVLTDARADDHEGYLRLIAPDDLAYVSYASTGQPAGVEVTHGNLANLLSSMRDLLGPGPADRWLALTSPAADAAALELFLPLITGGRVVIAGAGALRRPEALVALAKAQDVTFVQATPSVWRLLLPSGLTGATALSGGEALPARELRRRFGRVVNVYGSAETTIWSTFSEDDSIGRPIANTVVRLLDERSRLVPIGVPGELCVGGAGLADGYRWRPALTTERFVPDPFGAPGDRLYRTGDLARHREDGTLERTGVVPPLTPAQQRLWFLHRFDPADPSYHLHLALRLRGPLDRDRLQAAVDGVAARHESLRTSFHEGPEARVRPPGPVPIESSRDVETVAERVDAPFDLTEPPFRVVLAELGPDDHVLCFVVHQIVADEWSLGVLRADLFALYGDEEPPDLALRFADAAAWRPGPSVDYWRAHLGGAAPTELPADLPGDGPPVGARHRFYVPENVVAGLERLDAPLSTVLAAAYQVFLARHSGQQDIVVGTPRPARDHAEFEPIIGCLTDLLLLRADLTGDPTFTGHLAATAETALAARAHGAVPLEEVGGDLLQTTVLLHDRPHDPAERVGDLRVEPFDVGCRPAGTGLALEAWRQDDGLLAVFGYDTTRFRAETVGELARRFGLFLDGIAADPSTPISKLPLAAEDPITAEPGQAEPFSFTPGPATALVCGDEEISYAELDRRSAELAGALPRGGVVGVCLDRSVEAVVALLAVWRAGAAYLPMDPGHPGEWLAHLAGHADVVITDRPGRLPEVTRVITPDAVGDPVPWPELAPGDPAYVIFTSGSSGAPKCVLTEHGAVGARIRWMREHYGLTPADRVGQSASLGSEAHVAEIFPALSAGATVVLSPDLPVTVLHLPTARFHRLVDDAAAWPESLRLVVVGGAQVNAAAVTRFGGRARLVNVYGPAEATVVATAADLVPDGSRPPIGRPVAGTLARVLGPWGEPVPPGSPGELYLGGIGLARGYVHDRPGFTHVDGERLFRTGDRVRRRPDGQLEFLGRFDDPAGLRGVRIEAALDRPAVVTVRDGRLVAYVTGPAEMTQPGPDVWVGVETLPLTLGGRVDLAALPDPPPVVAAEFVRPRTDAETLVADVWADLLGLPEVGALDDFFALGGHSLLALRVTSRLREALELDVPIRTVFERPTVAGLALAVEELLDLEMA